MKEFLMVFSIFPIFYVPSLGKICETEVCKKLAGELKIMIDDQIDPCDDFSGYICGNMKNLFSIPPGGTRYNAFVEVSTAVNSELKRLLEDQSLSNHSKPQTKAAVFFKSCLDMNHRNKESIPAVLEMIKNLPSNNHFEDNLIYLLKSGITTRLISLAVAHDPENPRFNSLYISKPSLLLPEETLQSDQSYLGKKHISIYIQYMNRVLDILQIWKNDRMFVPKIVELHVRLAKILPSIIDQRNPDKYKKISIRELQNYCPEISWLTLINGVLNQTKKRLNDGNKVVVFSLDYVRGLCKVFKEYTSNAIKRKTLQMDLVWAVISHLIWLGSQQLVDTVASFEAKFLGTVGRRDLQQTCIEETSNAIPEIIGHMYVNAKFNSSQKNDIEFMIENIKTSLALVIKENTWMDSKTKKAALLKLKTMVNKIGYPDSLLSETNLIEHYANMKLFDNKLIVNYVNILAFDNAEFMKTVGQEIPTDIWNMSPHHINAYYNPSSNEIVFPAAILRYPFYDIGLPITYNYGAIGMILGHEILHGFDTTGSKYDASGLIRDWWTPFSRNQYETKTRCIIEQYGNYSIYNTKLLSKQTVGEDIADNAGCRMSYIAVNSDREHREKQTLPGLPFTADQLFFVGEAKTWCSNVNKKALLAEIKRNVHSVWKYRINGPLSNMPEFSKAFKCERNKKMNRNVKCVVWQ